MSTDRELMQRALDALDHFYENDYGRLECSKTHTSGIMEATDELRAALATPVAPAEPITVEAVAEVRDTDDGLTIDWLIEGGIDAMVPGCVLVCATRPITDDKGQGEVYLAPVAPAGDKPATSEPVATLHDDGYWTAKKTEAGRLLDQRLRNAGSRVDVYTAPPDVQRDAERYRWLREWMVRYGLLHALFCQPEAGMKAGNFWVLRKPYMVNGDGCEGYGKIEEEAIDAAMTAKAPT